MFRSLGSWFGLETSSEHQEQPARVQGSNKEGDQLVDEVPGQNTDVSASPNDEFADELKGFGSYLLNFATTATKKITESVSETAHTFKKSVEEGSIDGILDKTIIGDFQKEQEKFVQEKHTRKTDAAVPPWVGYSEEETIQQQILALSAVSIVHDVWVVSLLISYPLKSICS
ncbi:synapse-associated protein 1 [Protopterus annectens]|uniref:synapse-associated protein 1 n=1 Tax=Protopterus annectens TaxID=7888 RepID=UPI001CFACCA3|nr:synapse-associated protein 1 [Protopterus annectens]